jgi:hypothetical protein
MSEYNGSTINLGTGVRRRYRVRSALWFRVAWLPWEEKFRRFTTTRAAGYFPLREERHGIRVPLPAQQTVLGHARMPSYLPSSLIAR